MSRCIAFTPSDDKIVIWYDVQSIILEPGSKQARIRCTHTKSRHYTIRGSV